MELSGLTKASRQIEAMLDSPARNPLVDFLGQESTLHIEASGSVPSNYDIWAVRRNDDVGDEIFGPRQLFVGTYSEEILYGAAGSAVMHFRSVLQNIKSRAERAASLNLDDVEYAHEVALMWADVGRLKDFLGTSAVISEIVAEFRTVRFQFLRKDTPKTIIQALVAALSLIADAKRFDSSLVDRVVDALEY